MKTYFKIWSAVGLLALGGLSIPVCAETVSTRDLSADEALLQQGGMAGVLPPTGSQAALMPLPSAQAFNDPAQPAQILQWEKALMTLRDGQAVLFSLEGRVRISRKDTTEWLPASEGMEVSAGDILLTDQNAGAALAFDDRYQNVIRIPENTRVAVKNIEPTNLFLEDGTLFNFFDGLGKGSQWKVSTPTAVATVRGTWFIVQYLSSTGEFLSATVNVPDDDHDSQIEILDIKENGETGESVLVPEGNQIFLQAGMEPNAALLEMIDQKWLDQIEAFLEDLITRRESSEINTPLPPTSGEFSDPGVLDPAGPGGVGGFDPASLDPQLDTGSTDEFLNDEPIQEEEFNEPERDEEYEWPTEGCPPYCV